MCSICFCLLAGDIPSAAVICDVIYILVNFLFMCSVWIIHYSAVM
jgi:hypothetical protein